MENHSFFVDQADHEGGADDNVDQASNPADAANSGLISGSDGNTASAALPSVFASSVADASVAANEGASAQGGMDAHIPPPLVQPAMLGMSAAGHVVGTQARETSFAPTPTLLGGQALAGFGFPNLFSAVHAVPVVIPPNLGAGVALTSAMSATAPPGVSPPTSQPVVPAQQLLPGGSTGSSILKFASCSAEQLVHKLRQKIQALDVEAWKALDFDGPTILELSSPALLPGQLTEYFGYSGLLRDRVVFAIKSLVMFDESVDMDIRKFWGFVQAVKLPAATPSLGSSSNFPVVVSSTTPPGGSHVIDVSSGSFQGETPAVRGGGACGPTSALTATPLAPTNLFNTDDVHVRQAGVSTSNSNSQSFLSELNSTQEFSFEHTPHAAAPSAMLTPLSGGIASAAGAATAVNAMGAINITLHQPTLQKYNWMILENLDTRAAFYQWLKKNRRETIICDAANKRTLASLVSDTVRQDVMRIYNSERHLFDSTTPIFSYAYVTDEVLLKVLFFRFGPLNARDAVTRLKELKFSFDDSTTLQERFAPKLRRHTTEFRQCLLDMKYTAKLWPAANCNLVHSTIIDAFLSCYEIEDDIVGPDGRTKVPKCSSMQALRDMIRENKSLKLDEIIQIITKRFDDLDAAVRSDPLLKHNVQPWKTTGKFNARKRKFEQVSATADKPSNKKHAHEQGTGDGNPRCANCGSKAHVCSERTCYFWGHPKAKGPSGKWPQGTPSLRLEDDEMATWRDERQEIFYSYPENAHKKKGGNKNNQKAKPKGGVKK